jgi:hypothetical protein
LKQPLAIYLHDHLAGATYAIDLVEALRKKYSGMDLGHFAARLQREISADKQVLHELAGQFGPASDPIKDTAAWLSEKVSRMKLRRSDPQGLGTFEALEFLRLGIHGKAALWQALAQVASQYPALCKVNLQQLSERARIQEEEVELYRLELARQALASHKDSSGPTLETGLPDGNGIPRFRNGQSGNARPRRYRPAGHTIENPA